MQAVSTLKWIPSPLSILKEIKTFRWPCICSAQCVSRPGIGSGSWQGCPVPGMECKVGPSEEEWKRISREEHHQKLFHHYTPYQVRGWPHLATSHPHGAHSPSFFPPVIHSTNISWVVYSKPHVSYTLLLNSFVPGTPLCFS